MRQTFDLSPVVVECDTSAVATIIIKAEDIARRGLDFTIAMKTVARRTGEAAHLRYDFLIRNMTNELKSELETAGHSVDAINPAVITAH